MARKDQEKWDRKYLENPRLCEPRPPLRWIEEFLPASDGSAPALDLACGTGRNAIALARKGWRVEAVDLSPVALQVLTEAAEKEGVLNRIETEMIDLDDFVPSPGKYGAIVVANYLDRALIGRAIPALRPGGIFVVETYMMDPENEKPDANPDYLLQPGELKRLFAEGFEVLRYEEFWNEPYELYRMRKQAIVAHLRG